MTAAAQEPPPAGASKPVATDIARAASQRCRAHPSVSACDDALRWHPSDPSLLVARGDALMREQRPADAVRAYQRAAALAPDTPRIQEKIQSAAASSAKLKTVKEPIRDASSAAASEKRFSNSEPDTQTH
jgi:cytochrome c-type biogenesis protein CcmH/NrfG